LRGEGNATTFFALRTFVAAFMPCAGQRGGRSAENVS
jgi:hypothetical protein